VLKWLHHIGCPWDALTWEEAAREGHLDVLKWLREHKCPWDSGVCAFAAMNGHLTVLQWARRERRCPWNETRIRAYADAGGQTQVLRWLNGHSDP
jgi:hypothetical protein